MVCFWAPETNRREAHEKRKRLRASHISAPYLRRLLPTQLSFSPSQSPALLPPLPLRRPLPPLSHLPPRSSQSLKPRTSRNERAPLR